MSIDQDLTLIGIMVLVPHPSQSALNQAFSTRHIFNQPAPELKRPEPDFSIWNVAEDVKSKANVLSKEAQAEVSKASAKAQEKAGKIELYSPRYYAACTFGGLMACVGIPIR